MTNHLLSDTAKASSPICYQINARVLSRKGTFYICHDNIVIAKVSRNSNKIGEPCDLAIEFLTEATIALDSKLNLPKTNITIDSPGSIYFNRSLVCQQLTLNIQNYATIKSSIKAKSLILNNLNSKKRATLQVFANPLRTNFISVSQFTISENIAVITDSPKTKRYLIKTDSINIANSSQVILAPGGWLASQSIHSHAKQEKLIFSKKAGYTINRSMLAQAGTVEYYHDGELIFKSHLINNCLHIEIITTKPISLDANLNHLDDINFSSPGKLTIKQPLSVKNIQFYSGQYNLIAKQSIEAHKLVISEKASVKINKSSVRSNLIINKGRLTLKQSNLLCESFKQNGLFQSYQSTSEINHAITMENSCAKTHLNQSKINARKYVLIRGELKLSEHSQIDGTDCLIGKTHYSREKFSCGIEDSTVKINGLFKTNDYSTLILNNSRLVAFSIEVLGLCELKACVLHAVKFIRFSNNSSQTKRLKNISLETSESIHFEGNNYHLSDVTFKETTNVFLQGMQYYGLNIQFHDINHCHLSLSDSELLKAAIQCTKLSLVGGRDQDSSLKLTQGHLEINHLNQQGHVSVSQTLISQQKPRSIRQQDDEFQHQINGVLTLNESLFQTSAAIHCSKTSNLTLSDSVLLHSAKLLIHGQFYSQHSFFSTQTFYAKDANIVIDGNLKPDSFVQQWLKSPDTTTIKQQDKDLPSGPSAQISDGGITALASYINIKNCSFITLGRATIDSIIELETANVISQHKITLIGESRLTADKSIIISPLLKLFGNIVTLSESQLLFERICLNQTLHIDKNSILYPTTKSKQTSLIKILSHGHLRLTQQSQCQADKLKIRGGLDIYQSSLTTKLTLTLPGSTINMHQALIKANTFELGGELSVKKETVDGEDKLCSLQIDSDLLFKTGSTINGDSLLIDTSLLHTKPKSKVDLSERLHVSSSICSLEGECNTPNAFFGADIAFLNNGELSSDNLSVQASAVCNLLAGTISAKENFHVASLFYTNTGVLFINQSQIKAILDLSMGLLLPSKLITPGQVLSLSNIMSFITTVSLSYLPDYQSKIHLLNQVPALKTLIPQVYQTLRSFLQQHQKVYNDRAKSQALTQSLMTSFKLHLHSASIQYQQSHWYEWIDAFWQAKGIYDSTQAVKQVIDEARKPDSSDSQQSAKGVDKKIDPAQANRARYQQLSKQVLLSVLPKYSSDSLYQQDYSLELHPQVSRRGIDISTLGYSQTLAYSIDAQRWHHHGRLYTDIGIFNIDETLKNDGQLYSGWSQLQASRFENRGDYRFGVDYAPSSIHVDDWFDTAKQRQRHLFNASLSGNSFRVFDDNGFWHVQDTTFDFKQFMDYSNLNYQGYCVIKADNYYHRDGTIRLALDGPSSSSKPDLFQLSVKHLAHLEGAAQWGNASIQAGRISQFSGPDLSSEAFLLGLNPIAQAYHCSQSLEVIDAQGKVDIRHLPQRDCALSLVAPSIDISSQFSHGSTVSLTSTLGHIRLLEPVMVSHFHASAASDFVHNRPILVAGDNYSTDTAGNSTVPRLNYMGDVSITARGGYYSYGGHIEAGNGYISAASHHARIAKCKLPNPHHVSVGDNGSFNIMHDFTLHVPEEKAGPIHFWGAHLTVGGQLKIYNPQGLVNIADVVWYNHEKDHAGKALPHYSGAKVFAGQDWHSGTDQVATVQIWANTLKVSGSSQCLGRDGYLAHVYSDSPQAFSADAVSDKICSYHKTKSGKTILEKALGKTRPERKYESRVFNPVIGSNRGEAIVVCYHGGAHSAAMEFGGQQLAIHAEKDLIFDGITSQTRHFKGRSFVFGSFERHKKTKDQQFHPDIISGGDTSLKGDNVHATGTRFVGSGQLSIIAAQDIQLINPILSHQEKRLHVKPYFRCPGSDALKTFVKGGSVWQALSNLDPTVAKIMQLAQSSHSKDLTSLLCNLSNLGLQSFKDISQLAQAINNGSFAKVLAQRYGLLDKNGNFKPSVKLGVTVAKDKSTSQSVGPGCIVKDHIHLQAGRAIQILNGFEMTAKQDIIIKTPELLLAAAVLKHTFRHKELTVYATVNTTGLVGGGIAGQYQSSKGRTHANSAIHCGGNLHLEVTQLIGKGVVIESDSLSGQVETAQFKSIVDKSKSKSYGGQIDSCGDVSLQTSRHRSTAFNQQSSLRVNQGFANFSFGSLELHNSRLESDGNSTLVCSSLIVKDERREKSSGYSIGLSVNIKDLMPGGKSSCYDSQQRSVVKTMTVSFGFDNKQTKVKSSILGSSIIADNISGSINTDAKKQRIIERDKHGHYSIDIPISGMKEACHEIAQAYQKITGNSVADSQLDNWQKGMLNFIQDLECLGEKIDEFSQSITDLQQSMAASSSQEDKDDTIQEATPVSDEQRVTPTEPSSDEKMKLLREFAVSQAIKSSDLTTKSQLVDVIYALDTAIPDDEQTYRDCLEQALSLSHAPAVIKSREEECDELMQTIGKNSLASYNMITWDCAQTQYLIGLYRNYAINRDDLFELHTLAERTFFDEDMDHVEQCILERVYFRQLCNEPETAWQSFNLGLRQSVLGNIMTRFVSAENRRYLTIEAMAHQYRILNQQDKLGQLFLSELGTCVGDLPAYLLAGNIAAPAGAVAMGASSFSLPAIINESCTRYDDYRLATLPSDCSILSFAQQNAFEIVQHTCQSALIGGLFFGSSHLVNQGLGKIPLFSINRTVKKLPLWLQNNPVLSSPFVLNPATSVANSFIDASLLTTSHSLVKDWSLPSQKDWLNNLGVFALTDLGLLGIKKVKQLPQASRQQRSYRRSLLAKKTHDVVLKTFDEASFFQQSQGRYRGPAQYPLVHHSHYQSYQPPGQKSSSTMPTFTIIDSYLDTQWGTIDINHLAQSLQSPTCPTYHDNTFYHGTSYTNALNIKVQGIQNIGENGYGGPGVHCASRDAALPYSFDHRDPGLVTLRFNDIPFMPGEYAVIRFDKSWKGERISQGVFPCDWYVDPALTDYITSKYKVVFFKDVHNVPLSAMLENMAVFHRNATPNIQSLTIERIPLQANPHTFFQPAKQAPSPPPSNPIRPY